MKVLEKIPSMSDIEISRLFSNAIAMLAKDKGNGPATMALAAIEEEWRRRSELGRQGKYKSGRPEMGMLSFLGYHVGHVNGEKPVVRRRILMFAFEGELPFVQSPMYMDEWGQPRSSKRYWKLVRSLEAFKYDAENRKQPNMEKAIMEWEADLQWLRENMGPPSVSL